MRNGRYLFYSFIFRHYLGKRIVLANYIFCLAGIKSQKSRLQIACG